MTWTSNTNSDYSAIDVTSNFGHEITCDDGETRVFDLPADDIAVEDQSIRIMACLSNASRVEIKSWTTDGGVGTVIRQLGNSSSLHLMFDGTNNIWRIIYDNIVKNIIDGNVNLVTCSGVAMRGAQCNYILAQMGDDSLAVEGKYFLVRDNAVAYQLENKTNVQVFNILSTYVPSVGDAHFAKGKLRYGGVGYSTDYFDVDIDHIYRPSTSVITIYGDAMRTRNVDSTVNGPEGHIFVVNSSSDELNFTEGVFLFYIIL